MSWLGQWVGSWLGGWLGQTTEVAPAHHLAPPERQVATLSAVQELGTRDFPRSDTVAADGRSLNAETRQERLSWAPAQSRDTVVAVPIRVEQTTSHLRLLSSANETRVEQAITESRKSA